MVAQYNKCNANYLIRREVKRLVHRIMRRNNYAIILSLISYLTSYYTRSKNLVYFNNTCIILSKFRCYVRLMRVKCWRGYFGMGMLGYITGLNELPINIEDLVRLVLSLSFYLAFSFSINNVFDVESDRINPNKLKQNPIAIGLISKKEALIVSIILALLGITIATTENSFSLTIYIIMLLLSASYSTPPIRLKGRPPLDLLSHGFFFGSLLIIYGSSISHKFDWSTIEIAILMYFYSLFLQLRNLRDDLDYDKLSLTITTAVKIGREKSSVMLSILAIVVISLVAYIAITYGILLPLIGVMLLLTTLYKVKLIKEIEKLIDLVVVSFVLLLISRKTIGLLT